jgi:hypothetical protein
MNKLFILFLALSCAHRPTPVTPAPTTTPVVSKYVRKDWKHWSDSDRNCLNTRAEILKARSIVPVKMNKKGCTVVSGRWHDYYYPETHTLAKTVDIDHLVSLKNAHVSGGSHWSAKEKEAFANDLKNLVITNRTYNRKKGAKGIDQWLPVDKSYACQYAKDWYGIKKKYFLKISSAEQSTLVRLQSSGCVIF